MPLEIISKELSINESYAFTFQKKITQHMMGISAFRIASEYGEIYIETLSIMLQGNVVGETVTVTPVVTVLDNQGNPTTPSQCYVWVVVVAWTDTIASNLLLTNSELTGIENNGESIPIAIPNQLQDGSRGAPNPIVAALAGFNFMSDNTDTVKTLCATVGAESNIFSSTATVTGSAFLVDGSGNRSNLATVDGGLLANCDPDLPLLIIPGGDGTETPIPPGNYTNAVSLLSSFVFSASESNPFQFLNVDITTTIHPGYCRITGTVLSTHYDPDLCHASGFVLLY